MEMNMINKGLKPFTSIGETTFIYLQANFCAAFSRNLKNELTPQMSYDESINQNL